MNTREQAMQSVIKAFKAADTTEEFNAAIDRWEQFERQYLDPDRKMLQTESPMQHLQVLLMSDFVKKHDSVINMALNGQTLMDVIEEKLKNIEDQKQDIFNSYQASSDPRKLEIEALSASQDSLAVMVENFIGNYNPKIKTNPKTGSETLGNYLPMAPGGGDVIQRAKQTYQEALDKETAIREKIKQGKDPVVLPKAAQEPVVKKVAVAPEKQISILFDAALFMKLSEKDQREMIVQLKQADNVLILKTPGLSSKDERAIQNQLRQEGIEVSQGDFSAKENKNKTIESQFTFERELKKNIKEAADIKGHLLILPNPIRDDFKVMLDNIRAITPGDLAAASVALKKWSETWSSAAMEAKIKAGKSPAKLEDQRWQAFVDALPNNLKNAFLVMRKVDDAIREKILLEMKKPTFGADEIQQVWIKELQASGVTLNKGDLDAVMTKLSYLHAEIFNQYTPLGLTGQSLVVVSRVQQFLNIGLDANTVLGIKPTAELEAKLALNEAKRAAINFDFDNKQAEQKKLLAPLEKEEKELKSQPKSDEGEKRLLAIAEQKKKINEKYKNVHSDKQKALAPLNKEEQELKQEVNKPYKESWDKLSGAVANIEAAANWRMTQQEKISDTKAKIKEHIHDAIPDVLSKNSNIAKQKIPKNEMVTFKAQIKVLNKMLRYLDKCEKMSPDRLIKYSLRRLDHLKAKFDGDLQGFSGKIEQQIQKLNTMKTGSDIEKIACAQESFNLYKSVYVNKVVGPTKNVAPQKPAVSLPDKVDSNQRKSSTPDLVMPAEMPPLPKVPQSVSHEKQSIKDFENRVKAEKHRVAPPAHIERKKPMEEDARPVISSHRKPHA